MSKTIYLSEKNVNYLQQTYPGTNFGQALKILISHKEFLEQENNKLKQEIDQLNIKLKQEIDQFKNEKLKTEQLTSTLQSTIFHKLFPDSKKEQPEPSEPPKIKKIPIQQFFEYMIQEKNEIIIDIKKSGNYHPDLVRDSLVISLSDRLKKFNLRIEDVQDLPEFTEIIGFDIKNNQQLFMEILKKYGKISYN